MDCAEQVVMSMSIITMRDHTYKADLIGYRIEE